MFYHSLKLLSFTTEKAYDITYVRLKFSSPRPESFAIYKKFRENPWEEDPDPEGGWIPWQFYSASCRDMFRLPESSVLIPARKLGEDRALCTQILPSFSDFNLTDTEVPFYTLQGRPGAANLDHSPELQDWISATDIRSSHSHWKSVLNGLGLQSFSHPAQHFRRRELHGPYGVEVFLLRYL